jgi:hypothetical protein
MRKVELQKFDCGIAKVVQTRKKKHSNGNTDGRVTESIPSSEV